MQALLLCPFARAWIRLLRSAFAGLLAAVPLFCQIVTWERIRDSDKEPWNWLTYSGNLNGQRYSKLDQIHTGNAAQLRPAWVYQMNGAHRQTASPVVIDGILYLSESPAEVLAIDGRTGRSLWSFSRPVPNDLRLCCGMPNRGVAVLGDRVYWASIDAYLIALDAKTGRKIWEVQIADYRKGYSSTGAPLIVKDKVITGIAGGEYGIRGFLDAYDAQSGQRVWRFWTVPAAGEPGVETWGGESWKTGAASTWITGAYDVEQNLIIWGTGNPGPDWNGDQRPGDNLYSDCAIALDADTGKLKWYFQFTPHDVWDWDSVQVPILADTIFRGQPRKLLLWANRNGFYYVLDRTTGKFLHARPFVKQTWAQGIDDHGRPIVLPGTEPSETGTKVYPDLGGGANWWSSSYSPQTDLYYVAARERGGIYFKGDPTYREGAPFHGGGTRSIPRDESYGALRALKASTGELVWEQRFVRIPGSGVLSTAGGLVFFGSPEGDFLALNARNGEILYRFRTGAPVVANPVTYAIDGRQQVALVAGRALFVFELPPAASAVPAARSSAKAASKRR
ncbi:MAG: PQQ-dependent dehydrogenase, methanol/ethanol family [Bryobacteraceae bacterium]|nr:PQQ-dependent dehydrogenase, methanol/ethanol family [Bryobacteraceae bacterium]MDW8378375.1 PQQ-dependent dehydrogenase, methanol/ethanol family [Bryobacterales bacterium]